MTVNMSIVQPTSLNSVISDDDTDGNEIMDFMTSGYNLEEAVLSDYQDKRDVAELLRALTDKEREVIMCRLGFYGGVMTLEQVGVRFNVTRERIRQIEAKAIKKMRARAKRKGMYYIKENPSFGA